MNIGGGRYIAANSPACIRWYVREYVRKKTTYATRSIAAATAAAASHAVRVNAVAVPALMGKARGAPTATAGETARRIAAGRPVTRSPSGWNARSAEAKASPTNSPRRAPRVPPTTFAPPIRENPEPNPKPRNALETVPPIGAAIPKTMPRIAKMITRSMACVWAGPYSSRPVYRWFSPIRNRIAPTSPTTPLTHVSPIIVVRREKNVGSNGVGTDVPREATMLATYAVSVIARASIAMPTTIAHRNWAIPRSVRDGGGGGAGYA